MIPPINNQVSVVQEAHTEGIHILS